MTANTIPRKASKNSIFKKLFENPIVKEELNKEELNKKLAPKISR